MNSSTPLVYDKASGKTKIFDKASGTLYDVEEYYNRPGRRVKAFREGLEYTKKKYGR
jgi:hypothetical protein